MSLLLSNERIRSEDFVSLLQYNECMWYIMAYIAFDVYLLSSFVICFLLLCNENEGLASLIIIEGIMEINVFIEIWSAKFGNYVWLIFRFWSPLFLVSLVPCQIFKSRPDNINMLQNVVLRHNIYRNSKIKILT